MKLSIWKRSGASLENFAGLLFGRTTGAPIRSGRLSMLPLFSSAIPEGVYAPPEEALCLSKVTHYGEMVLKNNADRPTISPLHMGYFQKGAQNHAMCRAGVFAGQEERQFKDACCIQAAQGGYIKAADERFIILPQPLRARAFDLRGKENYSKLWGDIETFNASLGLKKRGHLDELKQAHQPDLLRATYRLERSEAQTGALFFIDGSLVGVELAPDAAFWAQLHKPLVMYYYAPLDLHLQDASAEEALNIHGLESLEHLERRLIALHERRAEAARARLEALSALPLDLNRAGGHGPHTVMDTVAEDLVGQTILYKDAPAYVSMTRRSALQ